MTALPSKARLTKRVVDALPKPTKEHTVWDADLPGFGLRLLPTGARTWILQRRTKAGRSGRLKIGRCGDLTADQARREAERLVSRIVLGEDPFADRRAARQAETKRKIAPTVEALARAWTADRKRHWRDATILEVDRQLDVEILPRIGTMKAEEVTRRDVKRLHADISGRSPIMANRTLASVKAMFGWAIASDDWPEVTVNPAVGVKPNAEEKRCRYPANGELESLVDVLHRRDDLPGKFYLLLLLTGARRGELENARWQDFDLEAGVWTKPASATKQRRLHRLPLSAEAVAILRDVKASAPFQPFVLDSWRLRQAWNSILAEAQIEELHVHDLRHWHASLLASAGFSLPVIGSLLGHSNQTTTQRYAHLIDEAQREAADRVGQLIKLPVRKA